MGDRCRVLMDVRVMVDDDARQREARDRGERGRL